MSLDSGLAYGLGALCLVLVSVSLIRKSRDRRLTARHLTREQLARLRDQDKIRQSMDELLTQLEEVANRVSAGVESRCARLEQLLREADARIERLTGSAKRPDLQARPRPPEPGPASPPAPVVAKASGVSAPDEVRGPVVAEAAADVAPVAPAAVDRRELRRRVYELADAQATPITIADTLHVPLGEVELLLNVRRFEKRGRS